MKFLFDCSNDILLPATFDLAEQIESFCKETQILELRKVHDEGKTQEEQAKTNLKAMLFKICKEYPKEAGEVCDKLWVLEEGEKAPNALFTFAKVFTRKDAIDFFTSLLLLVQ